MKKNQDGGIQCQHVKLVQNVGKIDLKKKPGFAIRSCIKYAPPTVGKFSGKNSGI